MVTRKLLVYSLMAFGWNLWTIGGQTEERRWDIVFENMFAHGTKPLYIYARERDGEWIAGVGSSRNPRGGGKTYNRSWYYADLRTVPIRNGKMQGRFVLHVTPDLWIPYDHRSFTIVLDIDATVKDGRLLEGTYRVVKIDSNDPSTKELGKGGRVKGDARLTKQPALPENAVLQLHMQGAMPGGDPNCLERCLVLVLGLQHGKPVSAVHGRLNQTFDVTEKETFEIPPDCSLTVDDDRISGQIIVPGKTLDLVPCRYCFEIDGRLLADIVVGRYHLRIRIEGKNEMVLNGCFDGKLIRGKTPSLKKGDD
ncbi:MAG: hypothetical protein D6820_15315, partial [Lentisphaerae bacterium]